MARKIIAGNWKMNTNLKEGKELAKAVQVAVQKMEVTHLSIVLAPPYTHLTEVGKIIEKGKIALGAQNVSSYENGAYTGDVSATMLKSLGVEAVIIGHSERRAIFGETGAQIREKMQRVWESNCLPILCVGENLEQRKANEQDAVIKKQLDEGLEGFGESRLENLVIAYEPVWAIGTGETASPRQAQDMHHFIRNHLSNTYSATLAQEISILYGGSVKPANAHDLFSQPDVNGGLIGGAALKAEDFVELIKIGEKVLR